LELVDPLGNSFIGSRLENFLEDPQIHSEDYERSHEENEDLGLNDMKTEGYEEGEPGAVETTGTEAPKKEPILPDRVVMAHKRGPDHPHQFAKGCNDAGAPPSSTATTAPTEEKE
ncbi:unnamed protein product, partial [Heterosigma akashiwo]